ncbi:UDP-3-O-acyl-N-acetylglucosamine deacetylase [Siculibacillus lacustris]|uniref:UDP-3-O-acyl-N-acetylglucosamine deacetylase n=1 Tax=Siculibacillus lacustris TaxID=1549641 RepID=A0A4Q9VRZ4_9HYPH|nr:UDP-3-O-acyl-N-acetylglucosamine deacetylase [Siculibacillus lacustris]TBW38702.1 UDP-3-O-acyl-N-acetylglucosamine deacetylase [Siculibacillus lacustris]
MARSSVNYQTTIAETIRIVGTGVHSGDTVSLNLHPADTDTGIVFLRTELSKRRDVEIPAFWKFVSATDLCTMVGDPRDASVATIEHLMAALRGLSIDNLVIEIDGGEVPVMDGSAGDFIEAIDQVGLVTQSSRRRYIKVLKPVRVENGKAWAELTPYAGSRYEVTIDFAEQVIGRQSIGLDLTPTTFRKHVARARTFGFVRDLEKLLPMGLCRGSSLENSVAIQDDRVLNPEGLRWTDEFVRHKLLDAIGDLALSGAPLLGRYRSYRGGHKLNYLTLKALLEDASAWMLVDGAPRGASSAAELGLGMVAPAYSAEVA